MTWSIVARDAATGDFGVAVASCVIAVGALCPWAAAGVGALSTQSYTNPLYGPDILAALAGGAAIEAAIGSATAADEGRDWRQVHGVDSRGGAFVHTGAACVDWHGGLTGDGVSVAGNMLAGPAVIEATLAAWRDGGDKPFASRLMVALLAGDAAGGDKRGKQSAAIKVVGVEAWAKVDLRIDDAAEPVVDLARLLDGFLTGRAPYYAALATRRRPAGSYTPEARAAIARGYMRAYGLGE